MDRFPWQVTEGWVYFVCSDYFTIEIGVKDKPDDLVDIHKKVHTLVLCQHWYWDNVEYIKTRESSHCSEYKSQEYGILIYMDEQHKNGFLGG